MATLWGYRQALFAVDFINVVGYGFVDDSVESKNSSSDCIVIELVLFDHNSDAHKIDVILLGNLEHVFIALELLVEVATIFRSDVP